MALAPWLQTMHEIALRFTACKGIYHSALAHMMKVPLHVILMEQYDRK